MREGDLAKLARLIVDKLHNDGVFDNCLNCMYWNEDKEICGKFKERPPAKVIVSGCEFHDVIPF